MIHPDSTLKVIDETVGYGVFATRLIPRGSIMYVEDSVDIVVPNEEFNSMPEVLRAAVHKYSYLNTESERVVSWDIGKYVNHCCNAVCVSTGWDFEIAVRDIQPGEEITSEYTIYTMGEEMPLSCQGANCRGTMKSSDFDGLVDGWDEQVKVALASFSDVPQPLYDLLDLETKAGVKAYLESGEGYKSIKETRPKA